MFYNIDRRTIGLILVACVVFSILASGQFSELLLTLPGVVIAMTFHEFAHAWMATKLGDTTPRAQGRATPIRKRTSSITLRLTERF